MADLPLWPAGEYSYTRSHNIVGGRGCQDKGDRGRPSLALLADSAVDSLAREIGLAHMAWVSLDLVNEDFTNRYFVVPAVHASDVEVGHPIDDPFRERRLLSPRSARGVR